MLPASCRFVDVGGFTRTPSSCRTLVLSSQLSNYHRWVDNDVSLSVLTAPLLSLLILPLWSTVEGFGESSSEILPTSQWMAVGISVVFVFSAFLSFSVPLRLARMTAITLAPGLVGACRVPREPERWQKSFVSSETKPIPADPQSVWPARLLGIRATWTCSWMARCNDMSFDCLIPVEKRLKQYSFHSLCGGSWMRKQSKEQRNHRIQLQWIRFAPFDMDYTVAVSSQSNVNEKAFSMLLVDCCLSFIRISHLVSSPLFDQLHLLVLLIYSSIRVNRCIVSIRWWIERISCYRSP